jgi:hypothetical protein
MMVLRFAMFIFRVSGKVSDRVPDKPGIEIIGLVVRLVVGLRRQPLPIGLCSLARSVNVFEQELSAVVSAAPFRRYDPELARQGRLLGYAVSKCHLHLPKKGCVLRRRYFGHPEPIRRPFARFSAIVARCAA